jgi:hypothetical protein
VVVGERRAFDFLTSYLTHFVLLIIFSVVQLVVLSYHTASISSSGLCKSSSSSSSSI